MTKNIFVWYLGEGIYYGCAEKEQAWQYIEQEIAEFKHSNPNISILIGMLGAMFSNSLEMAENKMDEILISENLREFFLDF